MRAALSCKGKTSIQLYVQNQAVNAFGLCSLPVLWSILGGIPVPHLLRLSSYTQNTCTSSCNRTIYILVNIYLYNILIHDKM